MQNNLKKILILTILLLTNAQASNQCLINEILKDTEISNDQAFWKRYEQLLSDGQSHEKALELSYLERSNHKSVNQNNSQKNDSQDTPNVPAFKVAISKKGQIELDRLAPQLKKKAEEFLEIASSPNGLREIRHNPGRWHLEELHYRANMFSVRLNDGYRILFELKNDILTIKEVNKGSIHSK